MITFPTSQIQKAPIFLAVVDPPRQRSRKCTLAISTRAPILAYPVVTYTPDM